MRRILCFDVESNGLHGAGFAFGAVLLDEHGNEEASIAARCLIHDTVDPWVAEHVIQALDGMPVTHEGQWALRREFRAWFAAHSRDAFIVVDCGWPVEARFLAKCVDDDPKFAQIAPYPLHDVATLLLVVGMDPTGTYPPDPDVQGRKHHPLYDARCSARLARKALSRTPTWMLSDAK